MSSAQIIGILNVTPDSYYDGGRFSTVDAAVHRASEMLQLGADIIEVGGESTGPGSKDVAPEEELRRTIPVVQAIHREFPHVALAIDTWKSAVAAEAVAAGASMVNDVTAGRGDPEMFPSIAATTAKLCLMHAKDPTPRTTVAPVTYEDVVATVKGFLRERADAARAAGIDKDRIILDPGLGHFVSSLPEESFRVLAGLPSLRELGYPILVSPSRKSFLAGPENLPPTERLAGTIAASSIAVFLGADYLRTHDVKEARRACDIASAIGAAR